MVVGTLAAVVLAGVAAASAAAALPADTTLARLREATRHATAVVWCNAGRFELNRAQLDSTGAWSADRATYRPPRVALLTTADAPRLSTPPRPIDWSTVDSVAVTRHGHGSGAVLAVTAGLAFVLGLSAAGLVLGTTQTRSTTREAGLAVSLPLAVAAVATVSALSGREHTQVIYRAQ